MYNEAFVFGFSRFFLCIFSFEYFDYDVSRHSFFFIWSLLGFFNLENDFDIFYQNLRIF